MELNFEGVSQESKFGILKPRKMYFKLIDVFLDRQTTVSQK
jgi:hypothetical protein